MDLYSAFRFEDTQALDAVQKDYVSLNRWVSGWLSTFVNTLPNKTVRTFIKKR